MLHPRSNRADKIIMNPGKSPEIVTPAPRRCSRLLLAGIATLLIGSGPLLAIIFAGAVGLINDPNPNPVGPGILAGLTFWPGVMMTIGGGVITLRNRKRVGA
jgi:hypothetical protein